MNDGTSHTQYDYGFRIYNPAIAKFLSVDPLAQDYPFYTPYQFAGNKPIQAVDLDGLEEYYAFSGEYIGKFGTSNEIRVVSDDEIISSNQECFPLGTISTKFNDKLLSSSQTAYRVNMENERKVMNDWANKHRNSDQEFAMSLFSGNLIDIDGRTFEVFVEGSLAEGEKSRVNPDNSKGPKGWKRSSTIHTHPSGTYLDFSNEVSSYATGGDLQWAMQNNVNLYMVPPSGYLMELLTFLVQK